MRHDLPAAPRLAVAAITACVRNLRAEHERGQHETGEDFFHESTPSNIKKETDGALKKRWSPSQAPPSLAQTVHLDCFSMPHTNQS